MHIGQYVRSDIMVCAITSAGAEPFGHQTKKAKTNHTEAFVDGLFA